VRTRRIRRTAELTLTLPMALTHRCPENAAASPAEQDFGHGGAAAEEKTILFPEKLPAERWIAAAVFLLSCLYLGLFLRYTYLDPDEGITLQGAQRILQGQVLYRDFFEFVTPGSYYFLAMIFRFFGSSMLVARAVLVFFGGVFSVFTYWMARRTCSRLSALLTVYLVLVTGLPWRFVSLHNWDSTLWACVAVYCAVLWVQTPHWGWALAMGTFLSLTFLFEQSKGVGLGAGLVTAFVCLRLLNDPLGRFQRSQWIAFAAGVFWPLAVTFAYFANQHALSVLLADWAWPFYHYSTVNRVPYGYQDWSDAARQNMFGSGPWLERFTALLTVSPCFVLPVLPLVAGILLAHWMLAARRGALPHDRAAFYAVVCCSLAGLLLSVVFVRANVIHFVYLTPLSYLVFAWLVDGGDLRRSLVYRLRPWLAGFTVLACTALGLTLLLANRNAVWTLQTRRGTLRTVGEDHVLEYMQAHVPPGSRIFVYPYFPLGYYLTDTSNATRYDYLQPGLHTAEQGQEAIREIAADGSLAILFEPAFAERIPTSWPNTPLQYVANDPVADYILGHYHSCMVLTSAIKVRFNFMVRNELTCTR
jgi:4-amino-4-deoxy-L-arabinose transferase-like glycosyltransferase